MPGWIEDLKKADEARDERQRIEQEYRLRCDRLIVAEAPQIWEALKLSLVEYIKGLRAQFPDNLARHLDFIDHATERRFTISSGVLHRNFEAVLDSANRVIRLQFRQRREFLAPVETRGGRIDFFVARSSDQVGIEFEGRKDLDHIAEALLRWVADL